MSDEPRLINKLNSLGLLHSTMGEYFGRLKNASVSGSKKVAWCTSVGPAELLYSMGFEVYFPENHSAMIASSKKAGQYIPFAVANGYSPEVCSYLTADIGAFLKKETPLAKFGFQAPPKPDALVYNNNQCHEVCDWFSFYADHYQVPMIGIHTPMGVDELTEDTIAFVAGQFRRLVPRLEEISGCPFDEDKFKETIRLSRDACRRWRQVLETARHRPAPINFFDSSIHMGPIVVMRGTRFALNYYDTLLAELNQRIKNGIGAVPHEDFRLYWEGMPIWFQLSNLARLLAKLRVCVVASTYCNSWVFDDLDPDKPFESSALAYTKLFIVRSERIKEQTLNRLLQEFSIDGIVYHEAKTCPHNSNNRFGLQTRLHRKNGIPFIEIQGDLCDSRCYSEEQSVMALETFVGQLRMRNKAK